MRIMFGILAVALSLARSVNAQDSSPLQALVTGNDNRGWEGVGRINFAGRGFCTGALIAPDLVLTAAHCLFNRDTGEQYDAGSIEFLAGWRNGNANAYANVRRAIAHPDYEYRSDNRQARVAYDVALLQLSNPIKKSQVDPFETDVRPRKNAEVGVVSYARGRAERPSLQRVCHVLARRSGTLLLSCDVDFGSSGAPIFTIGGDGVPRIVSVVSSKAQVNGRSVALGTSLEGPLDDLKKLINGGLNVAQPKADVTVKVVTKPKLSVSKKPAVKPAPKIPSRIRVSRPERSGGGAKFIRP